MESDYETAVKQAAAALQRGDDANWELARLTWQHTSGDSPMSMATWCADVRTASGRGFTEATGYRYAAVWAWWREQPDFFTRRTPPAWMVAVGTVYPSTTKEAQAAAANARGLERSLFQPTSSLQTQIETAQKLLALEHVADEILGSEEGRKQIYAAVARRQRRADERTEAIKQHDPLPAALDAQRAVLDLDRLIDRFIDQGRAIFRRLPTTPGTDPLGHAPFLSVRAEQLYEFWRALRRYLDTGQTDIDAFVREVLTEARHD